MALIQCPECNKEISDKARTCPNCGFPMDYQEPRADVSMPIDHTISQQDHNPQLDEQLPQDNPEGEESSGTVDNGNYTNAEIDQLKSELEKCQKDIDKALSFAIGLSALTILFFFIDGLAVFFAIPGLFAAWFWVNYSMLSKNEAGLKNSITLAEKDYQTYLRAVGLQSEILKNRAKKQQDIEHPSCPLCRSRNTQRISTASRVVSVSALGLASSKIGKQYECRDCKHKW